jgi:anthranilate phosphoribosyltransferase
MRFVMPVRKKLGVRTFFNILGPLCNPAGVRRQLVGAFSLEVAETMARILTELDAASIVTVHADDGLDECSLAAPTQTFTIDGVGFSKATLEPGRFGLQSAPLSALKGDSPEENAALLRGVLNGRPGPHRDVVLLNAALALSTSGRFESLEACFEAAGRSVDSGAACEALDRLIDVSQQAPTAKT